MFFLFFISDSDIMLPYFSAINCVLKSIFENMVSLDLVQSSVILLIIFACSKLFYTSPHEPLTSVGKMIEHNNKN